MRPADTVVGRIGPILRSSAHAHPQWRNCGGGRRSEQLEEILAQHGISWTDEFATPPFTRLRLLRAAFKLRCTSPRIPFGRERAVIRHLAGDYLRHRWYFAHHPGAVFLVEECVDYARLRAAREAGAGIVCCPHNFETMQADPPRDYYSGEGLPGCLNREISFTLLADEVFCISREEEWLLTLHGGRADFLPYFPPAREFARLARLREQRSETTQTSELFAFASGTNARNLQGLKSLARLIAGLPDTAGFHLHVGGFQTDAVRPLFPPDRCTFHGETSDAALAALMLRCKAAVIHQTAGTGALTRIPELLCAGVPVLASPHAARSTQHLAGVHIYRDPGELLSLARATLPRPPMPRADDAAGARLASTIIRLARRPRTTSVSP